MAEAAHPVFRCLHLHDSELAISSAVLYIVLRSICNLIELQGSIFDEDPALASSSTLTMAEATLRAFRCLHLHDSALALCRAVFFTFVQSTRIFFELHSSNSDEDSAFAVSPNSIMAEATCQVFRCLYLQDSTLALTELSPLPLCSPPTICLSYIAPNLMKIQLLLFLRTSPRQRALYERYTASTSMIQLLRFTELSHLPFCGPPAIWLRSISPILIKIQLLLFLRISPWQRPLFEHSAACISKILLLRFAELFPLPLCGPPAFSLSSIAPITTKIQHSLFLRIPLWQRPLVASSAACTFRIRLLRITELSPLPSCGPPAIYLSYLAPNLMKIQLLLFIRISPWQRVLFERYTASTSMIQLLRFTELSHLLHAVHPQFG